MSLAPTPPAVSVILPVYNAAQTVAEAVESILDQTLRDLELVICDDGSDDGTAAIIDAFAKRDRRVRVTRLPQNRGVTDAANAALAQTRSPLVARMDADDRAHPGRLEAQATYLDEHPDLAVCAGQVRVVRTPRPGGEADGVGEGFRRFEAWVNGLADHDAIARERFVESPVVNPAAMLRREVFLTAGGYRATSWAEDYDLWLRLLEGGARFGKLNQTVLDWRDGPRRLTRTHPIYRHAAFLRAKAHFFARLPGARSRGAAVCGAGPIGKQFARNLRLEGVRVDRFYEVHPRRIGHSIGGTPVFSQEELSTATPSQPILVSAVGLVGGRALVRALAAGSGYREGVDFFCVA